MSNIFNEDYSDSMALLEFVARASWTVIWTVVYITGAIALGVLGGIATGIWAGMTSDTYKNG